MNNPLLGMLSRNRLAGLSQQIAPVKNLFQQVKAAQNPQAMMNQIMQQNPQYAQLSQVIQESGGDPKKAFYAMAQQCGVNGDDIINMLKQ